MIRRQLNAPERGARSALRAPRRVRKVSFGVVPGRFGLNAFPHYPHTAPNIPRHYRLRFGRWRSVTEAVR